VLLLSACAPDLQGYWEVTRWEVVTPDSDELVAEDVGWLEFDSRDNLKGIIRFTYRGGDKLLPLVESVVVDTTYDDYERQQPHILPAFSGTMDVAGRAPRWLRYESSEDPNPLVGIWTGGAELGYASSYELERP